MPAENRRLLRRGNHNQVYVLESHFRRVKRLLDANSFLRLRVCIRGYGEQEVGVAQAAGDSIVRAAVSHFEVNHQPVDDLAPDHGRVQLGAEALLLVFMFLRSALAAERAPAIVPVSGLERFEKRHGAVDVDHGSVAGKVTMQGATLNVRLSRLRRWGSIKGRGVILVQLAGASGPVWT